MPSYPSPNVAGGGSADRPTPSLTSSAEGAERCKSTSSPACIYFIDAPPPTQIPQHTIGSSTLKTSNSDQHAKMTRYPPQSGDYGYQQGQYGGGYPPQDQGSYNQGYNHGYNQGYPPPQQQGSYGGNQGSASSYYGDQGYQQPQQYQQPYGQQQQQYPPPGQQPYGGYQGQPPQYSQPPPGYPPQQGQGQYGQDQRGAYGQHTHQPGPGAGYPPQGAPGQYPPGAEGDRGLMGALAGGAAGAFAGHSQGHGVLGGLGGAIGGSMLEDHFKKDKKHKKSKKHDKPHKQRRGSSSSSSSSSSSDSSSSGKKKKKHVGDFHASSRSMRLEPRSLLVAECADARGVHRRATIELNDCLTNSGGQLRWARGGNFAASSRGLRLVEGGKVFEAELGDGKGGWVRQRVLLSERIMNDDGKLRMVD